MMSHSPFFLPVFVLVIVTAAAPCAPAADLAFKPADEQGFYTFDTGVLRGTVRLNGTSQGMVELVHVPTGTPMASGGRLPGLFSYYRILATNARYGNAARDWPTVVKLLPGGALEVFWPAADEHPLEMTALYRWARPDALDVETTVKPLEDRPAFEVFLSSYFDEPFRARVYVKPAEDPGAEPRFVPLDRTPDAKGGYVMVPRDEAALAMIRDGRWAIGPNPVDWDAIRWLAAPLAMRQDSTSGLTALVMTPPDDCFSVSSPWNPATPEAGGYRSLYLSFFGRDMKAGQTARARCRLVVAENPSDRDAVAIYNGYLKDLPREPTSSPSRAAATIEQAIDVAPVWSGHPVRFALLTHPPHQYVAFYDADRQMTVAARRLDGDAWQFVRLPSAVGWDSHNYITMAVDNTGRLHLAGNMHCVPLVYFRTTAPHDVTTFERVEAMVGRNERRCTYPRFLRSPQGELVFTYRDGSSGNGDQIWNVYDAAAGTWRRLLDQPLFSGQGKMNAYFVGPVQDAQGVYHVCWVWRDTPDCATNHDLCYARSKNLVDWETSDGRRLELPITLDTAEIVDPVPAGGGMINGNTKIGFDAAGRPILSYHKFDAQGNTQLYNARREAGAWKVYQTSDWDYRWEFGGGGSIPFEIGLGPVTAEPDGSLTQSYRHAKHGSGTWKLDEKTLKPPRPAPPRSRLPAEIHKLQSDRPGMGVRTASDLCESGEAGAEYLLRWETLPSNRDRPHAGEPPPPSMLRLVKIRTD